MMIPEYAEWEEAFRRMMKMVEDTRKISATIGEISMMKYPHPETHKLEVWCYQEGWNAAIDRILNMEEVKIYELDMTIEKIRQLYREALELSFVKDPLGFALYSVWREREDRKEECTESQP